MSKWQLSILIAGAAIIIGLFYLLFATPATAPAPEGDLDTYGYGLDEGITGQRGSAAENGNGMTQESTMIVLQTTKGDITIELFTGSMPVTAGNFIKLASEGFYDGTKFHRVIPDFMIQGGDPLTKDDTKMAMWGTGGPGYTIQDEFPPDAQSNTRGTISMANAGPNTGGSQFFINVVDNTFLDGKHPVFGRVVSGLEVADAIVNVERNQNDRPLEAMVIKKVVVQ